MKDWIVALIVLPFNVVVVIPCLVLYFSRFNFILPTLLQLICGCILLISGLILAFWTMILFNKIGKGTPAPWAAPKHLVIEGPFKIVRNPMIIGVLLILSAQALILNSAGIFYWAVIFFVINCIYFKVFEEKQLEKKFGQEYLRYKEKVPMWLPKINFWR